MKFKRLFGSGLDKNRRDPRDKIWAEFFCDSCNEYSEIDVTSTINTFRFNADRRCPKCKVLNLDDKKVNIQAQLNKLTEDKSRIEIEIEKLINELDKIEKETL